MEKKLERADRRPRPILGVAFLFVFARLALAPAPAAATTDDEPNGMCCRPHVVSPVPDSLCPCQTSCAAATVCACPPAPPFVTDAECLPRREDDHCELTQEFIGVTGWECEIVSCTYEDPEYPGSILLGGKCKWVPGGLAEVQVDVCRWGTSSCP